jgi:hypothetical protein
VAASPEEITSLRLFSFEHFVTPATSPTGRYPMDEALMLSIQWYIGFFLYLLTQVTGSATALNYIGPEIVAL